MTAGIPGIGIGGLFYLLCALLMPLVELVRRASGHGPSRAWRAVLLQAGLAWGTLGAIWATGWAMGGVLAAVPTGGEVAEEAVEAAAQASAVYGIPSAAAGLVTLAVLALVLVGVQALRLTRARGRRRRPAGVHVAHVAPMALPRPGPQRTG